MKKLNDLIKEISKVEKEFEISLPSPMTDEQLVVFSHEFKRHFKSECPETYLKFLAITNGIDFNGYQIYGGTNETIDGVEQGIFQNNEVWHDEYDQERKYIFFAESGSDLYVFALESQTFKLLDRTTGDEYERYGAMEDMFVEILNFMLDF